MSQKRLAELKTQAPAPFLADLEAAKPLGHGVVVWTDEDNVRGWPSEPLISHHQRILT